MAYLARTKDQIIEGMIQDIGDYAENVEVVAWLRREIHAILRHCLQESPMATRQAYLDEIHTLMVIAIDGDYADALADEFEDLAR